MNKKLFLVILLINACTISCSHKTQVKENKSYYFIVNNLKNVTTLPDENFYPKGDSIIAKALDNFKKITPQLIEKISDTTKTKYKYADSFFYSVGDVAIEILSIGDSDFKLPMRSIIENEFKIHNKNDSFDLIFYDFFHQNTPKVNLENRKKLKAATKKWYNESINR